MDLETCIKDRRSVRKFTDEPITKEELLEVAELCRWVPSWKNTQSVNYKVIFNKDLKEEIAQHCVLNFAFNTQTMERAKAIVVLTYEKGKSGFNTDGTVATPEGETWGMFDAGVAAQTFCLAAYDKGIGSVILGIIDAPAIAKVCQLEENMAVAAVIAIGHPIQTGKEGPNRKVAEEIMSFVE